MCSGPYASGLNYDFLLVDKIFKKCRTASKNHEKSEGNVRSCVDSTLDSKNTVRIHYSIPFHHVDWGARKIFIKNH